MDTPLLDGIKKEAASNTLLGILGGVGALSSLIYTTAYMRDRAKRQEWERRMEDSMKAKGITGKVMIPSAAPMVMVEDKTEEPKIERGNDALANRY